MFQTSLRTDWSVPISGASGLADPNTLNSLVGRVIKYRVPGMGLLPGLIGGGAMQEDAVGPCGKSEHYRSDCTQISWGLARQTVSQSSRRLCGSHWRHKDKYQIRTQRRSVAPPH